MEHGTTVTSATYCDMLQGGLKPAILSKRRGRLSEGVLLLHDNVFPHTAEIEVGSHGTSGSQSRFGAIRFHLFGPLKEALGGRRFQCDEDVKNAVHQWLLAQPKTFYNGGIIQLVGRWKKCAEIFCFCNHQ
jgi:hypothetical protein